MHVRKSKAGGSSTGHTWHHDGAVVEVPDEVGGALLAHSPEFSDVTAEILAAQHEAESTADPDEDIGGADAEGGEDTENGEDTESGEGDHAPADTPDETRPKRRYTRRTAAPATDTPSAQ